MLAAGTYPSTYGQLLTFQAAVSDNPGAGLPMTFKTNGIAVSTNNTDGSGTAAFSTSGQ